MNEYSINTTNKCNWKCDYCLTQTYNAPERNINDVIDEIRSMIPGSSFSLCGGEPGMLSETDMDLVFEAARERNLLPLDVLTNGLFMKKHSKHLKDVDEIHYHCVETLKNDIVFYDVPDHVIIDYTVIVSESDYELVDAFMEKYDYIEKISLLPAIKYNALNKIKYIKLMQKYKHKLSDRVYSTYFRSDCNAIGF